MEAEDRRRLSLMELSVEGGQIHVYHAVFKHREARERLFRETALYKGRGKTRLSPAPAETVTDFLARIRPESNPRSPSPESNSWSQKA